MSLQPTDGNEERPRDGKLMAQFGSFFRGVGGGYAKSRADLYFGGPRRRRAPLCVLATITSGNL